MQTSKSKKEIHWEATTHPFAHAQFSHFLVNNYDQRQNVDCWDQKHKSQQLNT